MTQAVYTALPKTMRAIGYTRSLPIDDPQALQDLTLPLPSLKPHDLLVKISAIAANPVDYKIEVTLDMFAELAEVPNINALKESTRDVTNVTRLKNRFNDRFAILCGVDTLTVEELALGADGLVAGLVDAFPKETVVMYNLVKAGKLEEAIKIYRWFMPLLELDIHPKLVQYIKLAATQTGIGSEYVRAPRLPLEGAERERILKIIQHGIANRPAL